MSFCTKCRNELAASDMFCAKCGQPTALAPQDARAAQAGNLRRRQQSAVVPALKTEAGKARFEKLMARKKVLNWGGRSLLGLLALLPLGFALFIILSPGKVGGDAIGVLIGLVWGGAILWRAIFFPGPALGEKQYYSIPGSKSEDGGHRCIHCGGFGIYRHGKYKSRFTFADCSRCGQNLWRGFSFW